MSRHSIGWVALTSSRKGPWNWTGIFSAIAGRSRALATREAWEGSSVAASAPGQLGQVVADGGAVETLGGIDLVAVADGVGQGLQHGREVGLRVLAGGIGDEFVGENDPAARRAGAVELLHDLVLGGNGGFAQDVAFGFLFRHGDARIVGDGFLGRGPPFLELVLANNLLQSDFQIDRRGGMVGIAEQGLDHQFDRLLRDQLVDLFRLRLLPHQQMLAGEDFHRRDAENRVHRMALLALEIDRQAIARLVIGLDLAKSPAPVDHIGLRLHRLELAFGCLERRVLGDECGDGGGIHDGLRRDVNRRFELTIPRLVKWCLFCATTVFASENAPAVI